MSYSYEQFTEIFRFNADARHPHLRQVEVYEFSDWSELQAGGHDLPQDHFPGFPSDDDSQWITNPYWSDSAAHCGAEVDPCDPEHGYGFRVEVFPHDNNKVAAVHLTKRARDGKWYYITNALNTGLPTGLSDWRLWCPSGSSLVSTPEAFYVLLPAPEAKCRECGEAHHDDDPLHEYRVAWGLHRFTDCFLCAGCYARLSEPEGDEDAPVYVLSTAAIQAAMFSRLDSYTWNSGIKAIQDAVGQDDGGFAGVWWMDIDRRREWEEGGPSARRGLLHEYALIEAENVREAREEEERIRREEEESMERLERAKAVTGLAPEEWTEEDTDDALERAVSHAIALMDETVQVLSDIGEMEAMTLVSHFAAQIEEQVQKVIDGRAGR